MENVNIALYSKLIEYGKDLGDLDQTWKNRLENLTKTIDDLMWQAQYSLEGLRKDTKNKGIEETLRRITWQVQTLTELIIESIDGEAFAAAESISFCINNPKDIA